ncbi:cell division protein SepF [Corynebacterium hindlerae]|uniref:Cell division protein SepF n=1 Tax=Corynebacterium hindlerae TaxID=699041 RepID=A0A7G5FEI5_9CORY|nr:cell division protein SepF [Corynebacterium hindlerae]QMV85026.1 cell division protein SepF [Corynebacterium hindlerae]QTH59077.1 cell division protein SepF [Corynebacterium hindlerae]
MSGVQKFKEFFGLAPFEGEDEAYYADERRYGAAPAYSSEATARAYEPAPRAYEPTIVPVVISEYSEATLIGEPFRDGDAVVFDIADMPTDDARRIVDFAAGLCFALRGRMEKVESRVFAVIPENAHISSYELKRAARLG